MTARHVDVVIKANSTCSHVAPRKGAPLLTTNRELFHATMRKQNGCQLLYVEQGYTDGVYEDWLEEGLPTTVQPPAFRGLGERPSLFDHFQTAKFAYCGFNQFRCPLLPEELIEERDGRRLYRDSLGNTIQIRLDGSSLPHQIAFAIRDRRSYLQVRDQFTGSYSQRIEGTDLGSLGPAMRTQVDHIVSLWVHGPFAFLRQILGTEMAIVVAYEDPEWTRLMLQDHLDTCREVAAAVIEACQPDICYVWEDSCGKAGPMVSPRLFREFHLPWYKKWRTYLHEMRVPWMFVDSDGDPTALLPLWIQGGMDGMLPWEVNAVDILEVAHDFPSLALLGGIYKHMFDSESIADIDAELDRVVRPLRKRGGYFPSLDHWVYRGVPLRRYDYFHRRLGDYGKANQNRV